MEHPGFFERSGPFSLGEILEKTEAKPHGDVDHDLLVDDVLPLDEAGPSHITFFDNSKYLESFSSTSAGACYALDKYAGRASEKTALLISKAPYRSYALVLAMFYPQALVPLTLGGSAEDFPNGVHNSAKLEDNVTVEPGAIVGPEAKIGRNTIIAAGTVIGHRVHIGRDCYIGPNSSIRHALIGNDVIVHAGLSAGQDGFGFAMGPQGHLKVPQIGRVIIQDKVEIGANCTIDRGALKDTIIGEGTKIDNLVQIGHNVVMGNHCVIVSHVGISGSVTIGNGVVLAGKVGVAGHLNIGDGVQIAGAANLTTDAPAGTRWGGTPAVNYTQWLRETLQLQKITKEATKDRARTKDTKRS